MFMTESVAKNIGHGSEKPSWEKDINQAFLGVFIYTRLRKVMHGKSTKEEQEYLRKALDFFKSAQEGYQILTTKNHATISKAFFRSDKAMDNLSIIFEILTQCQQDQCFVHDKDFEAGRRELFELAAKENGTSDLLEKCISTLEAILEERPIKPSDVALPAFFFKVFYKEAHTRLSYPRNGCF